ncbi:YxlC family protein [Bacillus sp. AGMB 02131]|uniref:YxlC family protein n=1 Tax=Peribacillus faecalis TaxID=2772559 RepID=A0A927CZS3_9BACI|nr:YxlC family protein [Peribacillus faecalis]MBD3108940.1 YxlC family protein [Peribacillus faecalis]
MKDDTEKRVERAFYELDEAIDVSAPSAHAITMLVQEKKAIYKKMMLRELFMFLGAASVITVLSLLILTNSPALYLTIQIAGVATMLIYVVVRTRLRNREDSHI